MPAPKNNKNAQKGPVKASGNIIIRCTPEQKEQWKQEAKEIGMSLSEWMIDIIDRRSMLDRL